MICSRVSATTYFLPSIRVTTESGVSSMRSIRSEFRTNTEPESRVSVIMAAHLPCAVEQGRPWPFTGVDRPASAVLEGSDPTREPHPAHPLVVGHPAVGQHRPE